MSFSSTGGGKEEEGRGGETGTQFAAGVNDEADVGERGAPKVEGMIGAGVADGAPAAVEVAEGIEGTTGGELFGETDLDTV